MQIKQYHSEAIYVDVPYDISMEISYIGLHHYILEDKVYKCAP